MRQIFEQWKLRMRHVGRQRTERLGNHCLTTSAPAGSWLAGWQMCWRILQYTLGPTWCVRNYEFHNHFVNMRSTQDKLQARQVTGEGLRSRRRAYPAGN